VQQHDRNATGPTNISVANIQQAHIDLLERSERRSE
jgi:hypothetical protein